VTTPIVSVLMTSYNREKYIAASIESVLAQHYDDFELLITDNRSTDRSVEIAREYAATDGRIRVVVNERNLGQFGNRNEAARLAVGELIKYHDSDDLMYPHCLSTMVPPMLAEPRAAIGMSLSCNFSGGPAPMLLTPRMCYQREFLGTGMFQAGPACALFRRATFLELGGFPDRGMASDNLFWLHACARVSVLALPADLFWYRVHPGQEYQSPQATLDYAIVEGEEWKAVSDPACPLTPEEREMARTAISAKILKRLAGDTRAGNMRLALKRLRLSGISLTELARYARRPHRTLMAGTPLTADGEYVVPDWSVFDLQDGPK
jgi:hypothetical protein